MPAASATASRALRNCGSRETLVLRPCMTKEYFLMWLGVIVSCLGEQLAIAFGSSAHSSRSERSFKRSLPRKGGGNPQTTTEPDQTQIQMRSPCPLAGRGEPGHHRTRSEPCPSALPASGER